MFKSNPSIRNVFTRVVLQSFIVLAMTSFVMAQTPQKKTILTKPDAGFAVVELFTSQGCSSCPSADENLASIARQAERDGKNIITLSFHVDYWNYLGWKDPYSSEEATKRQRLYAGVHGSKQVYTPQIVVNGTNELLGSSREKSKVAIQKAISRPTRSTLNLEAQADQQTVHVIWKATGIDANDLLNVALVQNLVQDKVKSGENGGHTLKHVNVVRDFRVVNPAKENDSIDLDLPQGLKPSDFHVVAYVQSEQDADIHAAFRANITSKE
jgi:hypothetical protein